MEKMKGQVMTDKQPPPAIPEVMDFVTLAQQCQVMHDDKAKWIMDALNDAISELVQKAVKYRKQGKVTLELNFTPSQINQMVIESKLTLKEPPVDVIPAMAWTDNRGRLYVDDPTQTKLDFKNVDRMADRARD